MTTISDSGSYIDFTAFDVSIEDLRSLRALGSVWIGALTQVAARGGSSNALNEFIERTAELPIHIADIGWQRQWMHACSKLNGCGFSLADMLSMFNHAITCCEADLFGDRQLVGQIQLELFSILRRCALAAISCVFELGEDVRVSEGNLPGEFAAIRNLRLLAHAERHAALLSVSTVDHRAFAHLSAGELQVIPRVLSGQLKGLLRSQDMVFVGHEGEWLLLLPDVQSLAQPALAATQIRNAFSGPVILLGSRGVVLDLAIGVAMMPDHGRDPDEIILAARLARDSLKYSNESFAIVDDGMRQRWHHRNDLVEELRQAIRHESLALYLQPQVDLANGRCFGAELLLRWRRSNGDWVAPPLIVELIEENGWRGQFTDWLIRAAFRMSRELDLEGVDISLSLNLTAGDLLDIDLPEMVVQCLETWRLPASRFTFELTESAMLTDRERGSLVMKKLRKLGIRLALDDFGTGYSSLSYLATLPLNEIKVDRSFVVGMSGSTDGLRIVRSIIDLTHDLGMRSLAEGVESEEQRNQLLALGCQDAQGYLYSEPVPRDVFIDWYRASQT